MTIKSNVFGIRCAPGSGGLAEVLRVFGKAPSFVRTYDSTLGLFSADGYPVDTEIWHSFRMGP